MKTFATCQAERSRSLFLRELLPFDSAQDDISPRFLTIWLDREAVNNAGGMQDIIFDGATVVLKPNIVSIWAHTTPQYYLPAEANGQVTDWRLIADCRGLTVEG